MVYGVINMTVGERIRQRRQQFGLSVDELAKRLGKNRATIYRYESNEIENLPLNILEPLAKELGVSPAYLMGWEVSAQPKQAPILVAVKDGSPVFGRTYQYYAEGDDSMADFCLRIRDGSMIDPDDSSGDLVFVRRTTSVGPGVAVVALNDNDVLLGHIHRADGGFIFEPLNRRRRPVFSERFTVLGRAVFMQTRL